MPPLSNLATRDVETLVHPYVNLASFRDNGPLIIERGQGVYVYDTDGRAYIEGMAGLWCTALGYGNEELVEAAAAQMRTLSFAHLFTGQSHDRAIELAEKLKEIAPVPIPKVFFCNSGSEANDTQVKLVWYLNNARGKPQKKKIIGRVKAYHGVSVAGLTHRASRQSSRFRRSPAGFPACGLSALLSLREGWRDRGGVRLAARRRARSFDRQARPGNGRGIHRRAGHGRRRRHRAAKDLFPESHGSVRQARSVRDQRRSDLRVRAARYAVRLREARLQAAIDLARQGAVVSVSADRRGDDSGAHVRGALSREQKDRRLRPWLHLWRPPSLGGGRRQGDRDLCARLHHRQGRAARAFVSGAAQDAW